MNKILLTNTFSGRPYVYPTRPLNEEIVTGIAIPQRNEIVTGVAIPADNDVFDLTVTAQQNFGGKPKIQNINSKSLLQFFFCQIKIHRL